MYVDNFLNFAVGEIIPVGYYDRPQGLWQGEDNGIVVKLLDENSDSNVDGLDYTGDDIADDINGNGDTTDEVAGIENYEAGQTYWRGATNHFSPGDYNLSSVLPSDAATQEDAEVKTGKEDEFDSELECTASYVKPMLQSFHEDIPVTGTGLNLDYSSQRVAGYKHKITTQVSGDSIPYSLTEMIAWLEIGGNVYEQTFAPTRNQEVEFIWDGTDPTGTRIKGLVEGQLSIGYKYPADYTSVGNVATSDTPFNDFGVAWSVVGTNSTGTEGRQDLISWNRERISLQNSYDSHLANGWSLSNYHELSPDGNVYKGDGNVINDYKVSRILKTGFTISHYSGDDGEYRKGGSSIDYSVTNQGTLMDKVTGLEWLYTVNPEKFRLKADAAAYCAAAGSDWRLPTPKELTYSVDKASAEQDFPIYLFDAIGYWSERTYNPDNKLIPVICVQGQSIDILYVQGLKRNQTAEVVVDTTNGLMWQDDFSAGAEAMDWESSIDHCEELTHAGYDNWRLPNINELTYVLPNNIFFNKATYPGSTWSPFNADVNPYWSSTPNYQTVTQAWAMQSSSFSFYAFDRSAAYPVRCVRDDNSALGGAYQFDQYGKHLKTIDINTGRTLLTFSHNTEGLLSTITDQFGDTITLNRNVNGKVNAIQSPDGYVTQLNIDFNNDLARVDYDNATSYQFVYVNALMTSETDRNNNEFLHEFDSNGRAIQTTDPEGGIWDFLQTDTAKGGSDYGFTTAENNGYLSSRIVLSNGDIQTSTTNKDGLQTIKTRQADNLKETVQSCGVTTEIDRVFDPKTHDEIPSLITTTLPSNLSQSVAITKTYGENGADTTKQTVTSASNGKTSTVYTDYLSGERTITSPESRIVTTQTDPLTGLVQNVQVPGLLPTSYTYDDRGRIETETTGTRTQTYHYDDAVSKGRVTSIEAADGKHTYFSYDDIGRTDVVTYSDSHATDTDLDNNGNASNVNVPSTGDYGFTHNSVDKVTTESTPLDETTGFIYDKDRNLTETTLPSTKVMTHTYVNGLLDATTRPEGTTSYAYGSCGAQIDTLTDTVGQNTESIAYDYDGKLLTGITYQGELNQSITQGYNTDFLLNSLSYAGDSTAIAYDNDSLVTGIHGYTIGLKADNALPESLSDNTFMQSRGYNGYGEVDTVSTQVKNQNTYNYSLSYNDLGQIISKQETLHDGAVNNYVYSYDPYRRWLTTVTKNNAVVESYAYDANGNRVLYANAELSVAGKVPTYNIADQLTRIINRTPI
jgi:hypothetical protein